MPETETVLTLIKLATALAPVGTNALLLAAVIVIFRYWRQDLQSWQATLTGMITRYEALLERNAQVLTSLESKIE